MLDEGKPDVVLAFNDDLDDSLTKGGTEDMIRRAKKAGVPVYHIRRVEDRVIDLEAENERLRVQVTQLSTALAQSEEVVRQLAGWVDELDRDPGPLWHYLTGGGGFSEPEIRLRAAEAVGLAELRSVGDAVSTKEPGVLRGGE